MLALSIKEYMSETIEYVGTVCGLVVLFIGAIYAIRKIFRGVRPIKITPSTIISFNSSEPEVIAVVLTNRSEESLYVVECFARESKTLKRALLTHLKKPFIKPALYSCVWWGSQ
jgi:hypothetical protein